MSYLSAACKRLAMSDRESMRSEVRGESARLKMSPMVLLGSERLMRSVGASGLESGWGIENISIKTGDAWDSRLLRTRNWSPSDETISTSGSLGGLDITRRRDDGSKEERYKEERRPITSVNTSKTLTETLTETLLNPLQELNVDPGNWRESLHNRNFLGTVRRGADEKE